MDPEPSTSSEPPVDQVAPEEEPEIVAVSPSTYPEAWFRIQLRRIIDTAAVHYNPGKENRKQRRRRRPTGNNQLRPYRRPLGNTNTNNNNNNNNYDLHLSHRETVGQIDILTHHLHFWVILYNS